MKHDPSDVEEYLTDPDIADPTPGVPGNVGTLAEGYVNLAELQQAKAKRDVIAQQMWDKYQHYLQQHPELMNECSTS
jgi:predicted Rossmann-fold nucleotide-binding protein